MKNSAITRYFMKIVLTIRLTSGISSTTDVTAIILHQSPAASAATSKNLPK